MKRLLFIPLLLLCSVACAAPTIDSFSGNTIRGSSMGNAPDVVFFDDFENGTLNDDLSADGATFGSYSGFGVVDNPYYTNSDVVSGSLAMQANNGNHGGVKAVVDLSSTTEIFIDWHVTVKRGSLLPGEDEILGINWKQMWILGSDTVTDDLVIPTLLGQSPDAGDPQYMSYFVNGNDTDPGYSTGFKNEINNELTAGNFVHWYCHMKGGFSNDGEFEFWEVWSGGINNMVSDIGVNTLKSGGTWDTANINAYGRQTTNSFPTFDDVYIAVGENCQARIVVGDSQTFTSSSKTAIQVADENNWSATEIEVLYWNQGAFDNGETGYLFVIDANGDVSNWLEGSFTDGVFSTGGSPATQLTNITAQNVTFT